jgi:FkbM family methyltransferase
MRQAIRTVAEQLSRGRSFRYRLPQVYGGCRFYITPEAGLRYWIPNRGIKADETLLRNAAEAVKPGSVVWDVGANMGLFSFAAAGLAGARGSVYAFEPDAVMARLLRRSARLNPQAAHVEVIPCAVAQELGLAHFEIAKRSRASNALEGYQLSQGGGVRELETVVTVSLDWLSERLPPPDVLKIDVEGAELAVFRGAQQMLKTKSPILIFELTRPNWGEESRLLSDLGYTLFDSELPPAQRQPLTGATHNILGIPS